MSEVADLPDNLNHTTPSLLVGALSCLNSFIFSLWHISVVPHAITHYTKILPVINSLVINKNKSHKLWLYGNCIKLPSLIVPYTVHLTSSFKYLTKGRVMVDKQPQRHVIGVNLYCETRFCGDFIDGWVKNRRWRTPCETLLFETSPSSSTTSFLFL